MGVYGDLIIIYPKAIFYLLKGDYTIKMPSTGKKSQLELGPKRPNPQVLTSSVLSGLNSIQVLPRPAKVGKMIALDL